MPNNEKWEELFEISWKNNFLGAAHWQHDSLKSFIREQLTLARREERTSLIKSVQAIREEAAGYDNLDGNLDGVYIAEKVLELLSPTSITRNEETQ